MIDDFLVWIYQKLYVGPKISLPCISCKVPWHLVSLPPSVILILFRINIRLIMYVNTYYHLTSLNCVCSSLETYPFLFFLMLDLTVHCIVLFFFSRFNINLWQSESTYLLFGRSLIHSWSYIWLIVVQIISPSIPFCIVNNDQWWKYYCIIIVLSSIKGCFFLSF